MIVALKNIWTSMRKSLTNNKKTKTMKKTNEEKITIEAITLEQFLAISVANVLRVSPIPLNITVIVRPADDATQDSLVLSNENDLKQTLKDLKIASAAKTAVPLSESVH